MCYNCSRESNYHRIVTSGCIKPPLICKNAFLNWQNNHKGSFKNKPPKNNLEIYTLVSYFPLRLVRKKVALQQEEPLPSKIVVQVWDLMIKYFLTKHLSSQKIYDLKVEEHNWLNVIIHNKTHTNVLKEES